MKTRAQKEIEAAYTSGERINRMATLRERQRAAVLKARKAMGEKL